MVLATKSGSIFLNAVLPRKPGCKDINLLEGRWLYEQLGISLRQYWAADGKKGDPLLFVREGSEGTKCCGSQAERVPGSRGWLPLDDWQPFLEETLDICLVSGFGLEASKQSYSNHVFSPYMLLFFQTLIGHFRT
jgi:hypothetical protein